MPKNNMKNSIKCLFAISFIVLTFFGFTVAQISTGGNYTLTQTAIANGGASGATASSNGTYTIEATIGQSVGGQQTVNSPLAIHAGFWNPADVGPSAATVTVGGQVQTSDGRGIRNVRLTITDPNGVSRSTLTGSFGYFRFDEVEAGQTYIIRLKSKRYQFANETQVVAVSDEITDLVFTAVLN